MLERSVVHKRAREPRYPFCPRCGTPWKNIGSRFVCPNCGYVKLAPAGKREVDEKLARRASLEDWETAYARSQWRKTLPAELAVNGARWRYAWDDGERAIYKRVFADESMGW